jgi:tetratricopeptide (TPR) repeat protein
MGSINSGDLDYIRKMLLSSACGPNNIESPEQRLKKQTLSDEGKQKKAKEQFWKGYEILREEINHSGKEELEIEGTDESVSIKDCLLSEDKKSKIVDEVFGKDLALNDICNFSPNALIALYQIALGLHTQLKYEEASLAFYYLATVVPELSSFWVGLGLSLEGKQDYIGAIHAFTKGLKVNPSDFSPFMGIIRCCQQFKEYSQAKILLEAQKENAEIKEDVKEALEFIDHLEKIA